MTDRLDTLERLARLRADGMLTEEEFAQEKARALNPSAPVEQAARKRARPAASKEAVRSGLSPAVPDDNDLLAPIRPITDDRYAAFLTRKVWTAFAALAALEVISVAARVFQLLNGQAWPSAVSAPTGLVFSGGYLAAIVLLLWGISRWVARRASRVGAVIMVILASSSVLNAVQRPLTDGLWMKLAAFGLAGFALWFLIGVLRGALALQGRRPPAAAAPQASPRSVPDAFEQGRMASASMRRVIRNIAVGWLLLFLVGGGWFWWSTRRATEVAPNPAVMLNPSASEPGAAMVAAAPTSVILPSREVLVGVWAPGEQMCFGWDAYDLRSDGQAVAEAADGRWDLHLSNLILQMRTYDMDTDLPGPVEEHGGLVEMISRDEFRLTRDDEIITFRRC